MARIRLIATDLDGTLLNSNGEVSEINATTLKQAEDMGVPVVLASGRSYGSVRRFAQRIGLSSPIISANGGRVDLSEPGNTLLSLPIDPALSEQVFELCHKSGIYFEIYSGDSIYQANYEGKLECQPNDIVRVEHGVKRSWVCDLQRMRDEAVGYAEKYVVFSPEDFDALEVLRQQIIQLPGLNVNSSGAGNIEILHENAGKGTCLKFVAERLGVDRREIMAFGDNLNDKDMLEFAGWPVFMDNGLDILRPLARIVAPHHNESGVGRVVQEYVLNR